ncbi:MAG: hypothetical protein ABW022_14910 [Actinoplanes sp.]
MSGELTPEQRIRARELSWLLAAAESIDLWREVDGRSVMTAREHFGVSERIGEVTWEVQIAESAGLIEPRPLIAAEGDEAAWELTTCGKAALAELKGQAA